MSATCKGCGVELPPQAYRGRERIWCSDRCRKQTTYALFCVDCGKQLNGSDGNGPNAASRCVACNNRQHLIWTCEKIVTAIRAWADEHDGIPPVAKDWFLRHSHLPEGLYPPGTSVQRQFGSWNAGIEAAGFAPFARGKYGRAGENIDLCQETRASYEAGETTVTLAAKHGVSPQCISYRIRKAGGHLRSYREARTLQLERVAA